MTRVVAALKIIARGLAWFGAFVLLVLSPAIGSIASIVAVLAAVLLSPVAFFRGSWTILRRQPAMLLFLAAFASLTLCFMATAWQPSDVLLVVAFLGLLLAPVVYLLAYHHPGGRTIAIVTALCAAGALVGALVGSYDVFIDHKERAIGWAQGGNLMARSVVLLGFIALGGILASRSRWRWLLLIGGAVSLYALYLTGTRGVFVAVPFLGLLFIWALQRELKANRLWYVGGAAALILAVGVAAIASPRFLGVFSVLEQVLTNPEAVTDQATSERIYMWNAGWHAFWKSPLIGSGWAHLSDAALPYTVYFFHNDFFDIAVAAGVVGIVAWLATILAPIVGVLFIPRDRFSNLRLYCALLLSISFSIFGLTDMTFGYDLPTTLHPFLTAIVLGAFRERAGGALEQKGDD